MTINLGGVPIQDVRVAGVQAQRVMLGTGSTAVEVWPATITIIATTPTFLTASPWVTLPSQEGVTYSLAGTPGYGATVTVTATAQAGYELAGQTAWMHTYGPPPRYTASGSGGARNISARSSWETVTTHNVSSVGEASGQWRVEWQGVNSATNFGVRVLRNGVVLAVNGPRSRLGNFGAAAQSVSVPGTLLASGDQLQFQAYGDNSVQSYRALNSWSWSLS